MHRRCVPPVPLSGSAGMLLLLLLLPSVREGSSVLTSISRARCCEFVSQLRAGGELQASASVAIDFHRAHTGTRVRYVLVRSHSQ